MFEGVLQSIYRIVLSITNYDKFSWFDFSLFLLIPSACLVIEMLVVGYQHSSIKKLLSLKGSSANDIFCYLTHVSGIYPLIGVMLTFGVTYYAYGYLQKAFNLHLIDHVINPYLQFTIMLFVGDFKNYIRHYLLHRFNWSWELHKLHHSATDFTMLTYLRSHAAETILTNFLDLFPFIIFGANFQTFIWVYVFREAHQYFLHSQIRSNWGWPGKYLLVSPLAHRVHHSTNPQHYGKNLGNTFIIWDRLFGTYYEAKETDVFEIGIPENPYNKDGFIRDYLMSYKRAIKSVVKY